MSPQLCLGLSNGIFPLFLSTKNLYISPFCPRYYMPCPFCPPWVCYPNNIWWQVQMMKLLITNLSPVSCCLLSLGPNYSPGRPVLEHPVCSALNVTKTSTKPTQHKRQNHIFIYSDICVWKQKILNWMVASIPKLKLPLIKVVIPALNRIWSCNFVTTAKNFWFPLTNTNYLEQLNNKQLIKKDLSNNL